jgi:hypothetical protein
LWSRALDFALFLATILYYSPQEELGLDFVFPKNTGKIKADWYTGELQIPICNKLYQEPMENPVYESDWFLSIKKGKVISQRYQANY